jgi:glyoxylase-like metal-dependent hydrolase (beta-lactamase superfamily II)
MAEVKVLIEGNFGSTVSLVRDKTLVMIVDPGLVKDPKVIVRRLKKENLSVNDVNVVCVTHAHMDHYRNVGMFPRAKALDYWGMWLKDGLKECKSRLTENIRIMKTPGHTDDGISVIVKTEMGVVAICGDVFWEENASLSDSYCGDNGKLKESRKRVLKVADYIITGHGKMFKVEKSQVKDAKKKEVKE